MNMTQAEGPILGPDLERAVLDVLALIEGADLDGLREDLAAVLGDAGLPRDAVASALHRLDDAGRVLMRCGFYRLSEAERKRRAEGGA